MMRIDYDCLRKAMTDSILSNMFINTIFFINIFVFAVANCQQPNLLRLTRIEKYFFEKLIYLVYINSTLRSLFYSLVVLGF
jgi:hypothetical protein